MEDFLGGVSMIPLRGSQPQRQSSRSDGGLLSALSSYLMTPYAANSEALPEATDADVENTLCTIDCITSCRLDELYSQIMYGDFLFLYSLPLTYVDILGNWTCKLLLRRFALWRH